jgi:hypothetical protein
MTPDVGARGGPPVPVRISEGWTEACSLLATRLASYDEQMGFHGAFVISMFLIGCGTSGGGGDPGGGDPNVH